MRKKCIILYTSKVSSILDKVQPSNAGFICRRHCPSSSLKAHDGQLLGFGREETSLGRLSLWNSRRRQWEVWRLVYSLSSLLFNVLRSLLSHGTVLMYNFFSLEHPSSPDGDPIPDSDTSDDIYSSVSTSVAFSFSLLTQSILFSVSVLLFNFYNEVTKLYNKSNEIRPKNSKVI